MRHAIALSMCLGALLVLAAACGGGGSAKPPVLFVVEPDTGPAAGGTTLTLTGINFTDDMVVTLGGAVAADLADAGGYTCTCVTPPGSGVVDVVVTTGDGVFTLEDGFTYDMPPSITMTVPATAVDVLRGESVQISWSDDDPDDAARTTICADVDGNLATTADQIILLSDRPDGDGAAQVWSWDTSDVPLGTYYIVGEIRDDMNPVATDTAAARVIVRGVGWVRQDGGEGYEYARAVEVFPDGSSVVVGDYEGYCVFGAGEPNETELPYTNQTHGYVARYDAEGRLVWVRAPETPDWSYAHDVVAYPDGSCVVSGEFRDSVTFDDGDEVEDDPTLESHGQDDVYLARYDATGQVTWAHAMGSYQWDDYARLAAYPDGSLAVIGTFYYGPFAVDGETFLNRIGSSTNGYLARFEFDGQGQGSLAWVRQQWSPNWMNLSGVCTTPDGDCAIVGQFSTELTLAYDEPDETTVFGTSDDSRVFLARFAPDGALRWARQDGGMDEVPRGWIDAERVAALPDGSLVVLGGMSGELVLGYGGPTAQPVVVPGEETTSVTLYSADGDLAWVRFCLGCNGRAVAVDPSGDVVVGGTLYDVGIVGPLGPDQVLLVDRGGSDVFLARFGPDGTVLRARADGGPHSEYLQGLGVGPDGTLYATGYFYDGLAVFGRDGPNETELIAPSPDAQLWVARFNPDGGL